MQVCAHVMFLMFAYGWVESQPIPVMLWLGVTYSLGASCLWPILAYIIDKEAIGTAYGTMTSVQNLFLAVMAVIIGQLQDWAKKAHPGLLEYSLPICIFIGCAVIALVSTIMLIIVDKRQNGGALNASASERVARQKAQEAEQEAANNAQIAANNAARAANSINPSEQIIY